MAEILHFEILRKHGQTNTQTNKHTNKQTHKQTWALQYLALPLWGARYKWLHMIVCLYIITRSSQARR